MVSTTEYVEKKLQYLKIFSQDILKAGTYVYTTGRVDTVNDNDNLYSQKKNVTNYGITL